MTYQPKNDDIALVRGASLIITEEATELRIAHTGGSIGIWPKSDEAVKEIYNDRMRLAYALEELADRMLK